MPTINRKTCVADGCERPAWYTAYGGSCAMHYKRMRRNGTFYLHRPVAENLPGEEWREIPGTDSVYAASNLGRIKRIAPGITGVGWPGKLIEGTPNPDGYLIMRPYPRPDRRGVTIHRLVALAFLGPCPEDLEVNHIDGDRQNNALSNLEYVTHQENVQHAFALRRIERAGEQNGRAKLTEEDVRAIRAARAAGVSSEQLAEQYGIGKTAAYDIVARRSWTHI